MRRHEVRQANVAEFVARVRREEHVRAARIFREVPDTCEPGGDSASALGGGCPPGTARGHDHERRSRGVPARNSRQHVAGFGILDRRVGDKTRRRSGLRGGIQPLDLLRRNLKHRRSVRLGVLRGVQQRQSRNAFRRR